MPGSFRNYGKVDPYLQLQLENRRKERRRIFTIVGASVFLVVVIICVVVGVVLHKNSSSNPNESNNVPLSTGSAAIQAACNTTRFPDTCNEEFNSRPESLTANPLQLVTLGVKIAQSELEAVHSLALELVQQAGLDPREKMALEDCTEMLGNTMDYLNSSLVEFSTIDISSLQTSLENIEVLLSTASSEQSACSDNFDNITGSATSSLLLKQEYVNEVLINALCLVDTLTKLGPDLSSWKSALPSLPKIHLRRLLSAEPAVPGDGVLENWAALMERKLAGSPSPSSPQGANMVVAQDGSGNYKTLKQALNHVPDNYSNGYVIYIKAGIYDAGGPLNISNDFPNLTLLGDGCNKTIITGNANVALAGYTTYRSATLGIASKGFLARGITFRNTAGPVAQQAVAIRANAEDVVFDSCCFEGYQDTLYALSGKQFYRGCTILGTVDFIFGNSLAVFQNCSLVAHMPLLGQQNTYTAQGRKDKVLKTGFVFQNCSLIASAALKNTSFPVSTYLGRPWKAYSTSVFMESYYAGHVNPAGWLSWNLSNPFQNTCYYAEYMNHGPGAGVGQRVNWTCVHPAISRSDASKYTVQTFYPDATFIPSSVPYQASL